MAAAIPIRGLYAHLGFSAGTATNITEDQVIDSLDELKILHDNYCENLCKSIP